MYLQVADAHFTETVFVDEPEVALIPNLENFFFCRKPENKCSRIGKGIYGHHCGCAFQRISQVNGLLQIKYTVGTGRLDMVKNYGIRPVVNGSCKSNTQGIVGLADAVGLIKAGR